MTTCLLNREVMTNSTFVNTIDLSEIVALALADEPDEPGTCF
jgi:hypothetical protein